MTFDDRSECSFLGVKTSDLLKLIQESNGKIAIIDESSKIRETLRPLFQDSSEQLELGTNNVSTVY